MLRNIDLQKWAVFGLLTLHIAWIGNHMRLVASDQINPWRLGGYAMYTIPTLGQSMRVYDATVPGVPMLVNTRRYEGTTRFTNAWRTFRCASIPSVALRSFFDENQTLIGRNLVFVYHERRFVRSPPSTRREIQGTVEVTWRDERTFTYTSKFCGKEQTETATLL